MIDSGPLEGKELQKVFASPLPSGAFATWIFVVATNSFVRFAGRAASFEWLE